MSVFWSKRGVVACEVHAPTLESDEWRTQGWQQVPRLRQGNATELQCQFCHGRPYVHHPRDREAAVNDD